MALRERAVAGHLPLDRQGQRNSAHNYGISFIVLAMKTRNWCVSVNNEFLHTTPHNHTGGISKTRPVSKACQHVMSVIDSKNFVRSSKREQRIVASRSVRWALLHRERRFQICVSKSQHGLTGNLSHRSVCDLNVQSKTVQTCYSGIYTSVI